MEVIGLSLEKVLNNFKNWENMERYKRQQRIKCEKLKDKNL